MKHLKMFEDYASDEKRQQADFVCTYCDSIFHPDDRNINWEKMLNNEPICNDCSFTKLESNNRCKLCDDVAEDGREMCDDCSAIYNDVNEDKIYEMSPEYKKLASRIIQKDAEDNKSDDLYSKRRIDLAARLAKHIDPDVKKEIEKISNLLGHTVQYSINKEYDPTEFIKINFWDPNYAKSSSIYIDKDKTKIEDNWEWFKPVERKILNLIKFIIVKELKDKIK